jgi:hypothetical protein
VTTGEYLIRLVLAVPCVTCDRPCSIPLHGLAECPGCGGELPSDAVKTVRDAIVNRRQAFKGRLSRLEQRVRELTENSPDFATRGLPLDAVDHLTRVLQPAMAASVTSSERIQETLGRCGWDPSEGGCIDAFKELVGELERALASYETLRQTMPPVEWRSAHRQLVRSVREQIRGQMAMALVISAPEANTAFKLQEEGSHSFSRAAEHARRLVASIDRAIHANSEGPFELDGSLDVAALAWTSIGEGSVSIASGAQMVREAFAGVPSLDSLPDEYSVLLLPALAQDATIVDHETLIERTKLLRAILDHADATASWLREPELLVSRIQRGLDRVTDEVERLGREWRYGLPREHVMRSQTEVYRQLIEGALRDIGGVLLIAARASRSEKNAEYEEAIADGVMAGEIVSELERIGAPCGGAVKMLYRNASAHCDILVTETGITATGRVIEDGRLLGSTTEHLSDAEFSEEVVALHEVLLALQFAVLPWMWGHSDQGLAGALRAASLSARQRNHVLGLLAGMAGLRNLRVAVEGKHVTITAERHEDKADRRETRILSVVPGAFGAIPEAADVTLHLEGGDPVVFERAEFAYTADDETSHGLTMLGLTTAKWIVQGGASWTARDEATYVTFPLTRVHFDCMRLAGSVPDSTENIDAAVAAAGAVLERLDGILPEDRQSLLSRRATEQLTLMTAALRKVAEGRRGLHSPEATMASGQEAVATLEVMYQIQGAAKVIRDRIESPLHT